MEGTLGKNGQRQLLLIPFRTGIRRQPRDMEGCPTHPPRKHPACNRHTRAEIENPVDGYAVRFRPPIQIMTSDHGIPQAVREDGLG